jgi:hypothetical protein
VGLYTGLLLVSQLFSGFQTWPHNPDILICDSSRVTISRVNKAVDFWRPLGHSFGNIRKALPDNIFCARGEPPYGVIMIDIPSQGFNFNSHLGTTKTWWNTTTGEIIKSKIEIKTGWESTERVLEHEIGHALGFSDNSITGHMMHRAWIKGGRGDKNLRARP